MEAVRFRLSGDDYEGDVALAMYEVAQVHGFERIGVDLHPWPIQRSNGITAPRFVVDAEVSGVSAWCELAFDSADDALSWVGAHPLVEPREPAATNAYRAILSASLSGTSSDLFGGAA
jgi:hypothetical protein